MNNQLTNISSGETKINATGLSKALNQNAGLLIQECLSTLHKIQNQFPPDCGSIIEAESLVTLSKQLSDTLKLSHAMIESINSDREIKIIKD